MSDVRLEREGPVAVVTMARPERHNAVDGPMAAELAEAMREVDASDAAVGVLRGDGPSFCAGANLKAVGGERGNRMAPDGDGPMGISRLRMRKPVIAAVHGYAVAGGMELALWCDLRVVERGATFGIFCRRWGVPLVDGGTVRLPRLIGQSRALDLILTGRPVGGPEAYEIGLANRLVDDGTATEQAIALARDIARMPQECLRNDRQSVLGQWGLDEEAAMRAEFGLGVESLRADGLSGARRFAGGAGRGGSFDDL
ncbi:crotonase/enoyl-CoA hydratase family protein [Cumulibacter manganitolerans]|uniref:crotonase/enoyl-CoA hydratase family protein n=1 Tax=Cumulibacter manganitolerans TaxID=1884992 RepID=UPI0012957470|nr:crotonase/enoyl-CoA hydratase family protein [Cumulibacter manganitolerans]